MREIQIGDTKNYLLLKQKNDKIIFKIVETNGILINNSSFEIPIEDAKLALDYIVGEINK